MDRQGVKPPFAYYGGKTTLAPQIAALLPKHEHYVEPFAGSLAVLLAKKPSRAETVNDLDGDLMTFWRVLRDQPEELSRLALLTPHARAELDESQSLDGLSDLERARRVWVRLTQSRAQSMKQTGWKYMQDPAGRSMTTVRNLIAFAARMESAAMRLRTVSLECRDALDVIRDYGKHPNVLLYCDPPYLATSRNSTNYRHEMAGQEQHRELADALHICRASVVLSGYPSPLYDEMFADWHHVDLAAWTGNGIRDGATKTDGKRTEVLWSNRPLAKDLTFDFGSAS